MLLKLFHADSNKGNNKDVKGSKKVNKKDNVEQKSSRSNIPSNRLSNEKKEQDKCIKSSKCNRKEGSKKERKKYNKKDKFVYFFGKGKTEGNAHMADILGGKGAGLAEMTNIGIPVPAGFTISTEICEYFYKHDKKYPSSLKKEVEDNLKKLEAITGKKFGDTKNPLLISVRSGASVSMPGMMDTILNLGINDETVLGLAKRTKNEHFAYDTYRRFIQMFGNVVYGISIDEFESVIKNTISKKNNSTKEDYTKKKGKKDVKCSQKNVPIDKQLTLEDIKQIVKKYKDVYKKHTKKDFPQDPKVQLWIAIDAVFGSWMNDRAIKYREYNNIKNSRGTAVNIQSMVFGNYGKNSGTGVCFSRNPITGEKKIYGEYLQNAQGEDVVAGIRTPMTIDFLKKKKPTLYKKLVEVVDKLEHHYRDMQDIEFTICNNELFLLQTRIGKRNGQSAVRCAVDMVNEKIITKEEAITRITQKDIEQLLHKTIDEKDKKGKHPIAVGLNVSFGAGFGEIVCSSKEAKEKTEKGRKVILVRQNTSPEDISGMIVASGVLTSVGGATSHAAIVSRGIGIPCVICAGAISFDGNNVIINNKKLKKGDIITIDGTTGDVFKGKMNLINYAFDNYTKTFLKWCDKIGDKCTRNKMTNKTVKIKTKINKTSKTNSTTELKGFYVYANADLPVDVKKAIELGANGIGLCRTEHMFFDKKKLMPFRAMISSDTKELREKYLKQILTLQQKDFEDIFKVLDGRSVIIRLLDPPLHEFVTKTVEENKELAKFMGCNVKQLVEKTSLLQETNPMMGHRGCRLAITYPEIYEMQVEAICNAIINCTKKNIKTHAKIMIPIVCDGNELSIVRSICVEKIKAIFSKKASSKNTLSKETLSKGSSNRIDDVIFDTYNNNDNFDTNFNQKTNKVIIPIGTMIETPRASITADKIANYADFFSFGTNDLTQTTFALSRDDTSKLLSSYIDKNIIINNPFKTLDQDGVGGLMKLAVRNGRSVKQKLQIGICGEHGGDPKTIDFCYKIGLNYVSCSPFRVPTARLSVAQAVINDNKKCANNGHLNSKKSKKTKI